MSSFGPHNRIARLVLQNETDWRYSITQRNSLELLRNVGRKLGTRETYDALRRVERNRDGRDGKLHFPNAGS
jgi:hypothetical protein